MPSSVVEADWYSVLVYDLVVIIAEQLDRVSSGSGSVGCFICNMRV